MKDIIKKIIQEQLEDFGSDDVNLKGHEDFLGKVYIHRNLNKPGYWSIKEKNVSGNVIGYDTKVRLEDVIFHVAQGGKKRVRQEKRKNVHAGVWGYISPRKDYETDGSWQLVTYNPYLYDTFVILPSEEPVYGADEAILKNTKEVWVKNPIHTPLK